jgi:hypothetical protein
MRKSFFIFQISFTVLILANLSSSYNSFETHLIKRPSQLSIENNLFQDFSNSEKVYIDINNFSYKHENKIGKPKLIGGDFIRAFKRISPYLKFNNESDNFVIQHLKKSIPNLLFALLIIITLIFPSLIGFIKNIRQNLNGSTKKMALKFIIIISIITSVIIYLLTVIVLNSDDPVGKTKLEAENYILELLFGLIITFAAPALLIVLYKRNLKKNER